MEANVKKNFLFLSLYKVLEMLLPMITSPLLSRRLGAESLGEYTFYYSIVSMFIVVAELGCYRYGIREIAKVRDNKNDLKRVYSEIFFAHFLNGFVVGVAYLVFLFINKEWYLIQIIMLLFIISNMIDNSFLYIGIEKVGPLTLRDSIVKISSFILIVIFIKKSDDLLVYVLIMTLSTLICRIISLMFSFNYVFLELPSLEKCFSHYKPMLALTIPALAAVIYQSMDRIMIGYFYNNADVGYYDCASKALIPRNIITALGTVLCPGVANMYAKREYRKLDAIIENSFIISLIMSYIFMFGIIAIAQEFAPWFWGENFSVCSPMIIGLSFTIPVWTVGEVIRNQYLLPIGRDKEYIISFLIGATVNALINILLIPKWGAFGAIIATIIAEMSMSISQIHIVRRELKIINYLIVSIPYLIMGGIMVLLIRLLYNNVLYCLNNKTICLLLETIIGALSYFVMVVIYELLSKKYYILNVFKIAKSKN
jgi:O-antigen/teichoic acid export membrane protein